ncbi:MAG: DUF1573 domain-containing protein [Planctomycetaceae bacterium]|nr:DUF1573 domain-containing protein [Planctomycetaceae bacterium]
MLRHAFLAASLFLVLGSTVSAQTWAEKMFQERTHDFGDVARGAKAEFRYELTNLYEEEVHISSVTSTCGCTTPWIEKQDLKTHETTAIVAKINTDRFLGQKGATLTVTFDKPYYAQVQLQARAYIRSDVVFNPGSVEIGAVAEGQAADRQVTLAHAGRSDWQILEVTCTNPHLSATFEEIGRSGGNTQYRISVHLDETMPVGYLNEHVVLKTNDYNRTQVPLLVQGRVEPSIVVSPATLFMGNVEPGQTVTKNIVLRGAKPFRVVSVNCADGSFKFEIPDDSSAPKTVHIIPVTFVGGTASRKLEQIIRVETDLGTPVPDLPTYAVVQ